MRKNRTDLKIISIVILAMSLVSLVRSIVSLCVYGLPSLGEVPEGVTAEAMRVIAIVVCVVGFAVCLPQIYVGVKGLLIADGADGSGKLHKIFAVALALLAAVNVGGAISALFGGFEAVKLLELLDSAVDVALYVFYVIFASQFE